MIQLLGRNSVRALFSRAMAVRDRLTPEAVTEPFLSRSFQPSTSRKIDPDLARGRQFPRNSHERMQVRREGDGRDSSQLESHILHLQSQVDVLTREVRAGQGLPMYEEAP
jgi:hypothetical protein